MAFISDKEREDFKNKVMPVMLKSGKTKEDAEDFCDWYVDYIETHDGFEPFFNAPIFGIPNARMAGKSLETVIKSLRQEMESLCNGQQNSTDATKPKQ